MSYQPATINGSGGFSKLNSPGTISGEVACVSGDCWVRFVKTATVTVSGANANLTNPETQPFTDGWAHLAAGNSLPFGSERVADTSYLEIVMQIDVYCTDVSEVLINQH